MIGACNVFSIWPLFIITIINSTYQLNIRWPFSFPVIVVVHYGSAGLIDLYRSFHAIQFRRIECDLSVHITYVRSFYLYQHYSIQFPDLCILINNTRTCMFSVKNKMQFFCKIYIYLNC